MIDIRSTRDLLRLYFIYRREFRIAFMATAVLVVLAALFMPARYVSDARLLVQPGREALSVPIEVGDRQTVAPLRTSRDPLLDEEQMLTGRPVVMEVARLYLEEASRAPEPVGVVARLKSAVGKAASAAAAGLDSALATAGLTEPRSPEEALAERLLARFTVSHAPGSNVMELRITWKDPQAAQSILRTWIRVFTDQRTAVLGRKSLVTFYEGKVRAADQQIEATKSQLREKLADIDGVSARERLDTLTVRLNSQQNRLSELQAERTALLNGLDYAHSTARNLPREIVAEREIGQTATWSALSAQLAELKRQRADAQRVFKESAPAMKALNESIATMEAQLRSEDRVIQRSERRTPNDLTTTLERSQVEKAMRLQEITALQKSLTQDVAELEKSRQRVLESEPELARLEQTLVSAEKSRALYLESLERARVDQALDESRINNLAPIQEASFNPRRAFPRTLPLLLLALPAGVLVGLLVIYLSATFDQRIHDGGRMEARFGVPLWAAIKDVAASGADNDFHASLHRLAGTLDRERIQREGLVLGLTSARQGEGVSFLTGHLQRLLQARGVTATVNPSPVIRRPGEVVLLEAAGLQHSPDVFHTLSDADQIVLVVEARASTVPQVEGALGALRTAFRQVDGVILNRRHFEVPARVLRWVQG